MVRTHSGCPPPPAQIVQPLVWRTVRSNSEPRSSSPVTGSWATSAWRVSMIWSSVIYINDTRTIALRQAFFSKKTKPRSSRRSNLVKGHLPHSPRTNCPSLRFLEVGSESSAKAAAAVGHGMRVMSQSPDPLARMHTMTKRHGKSGTIDVKALLREDEGVLRALVRTALQEVLEPGMTEAWGAEKGERAGGRQGYRSGYYGRTLITRVGKLELRVPQDRTGRFSTELFERYQRSERALVAALAEMYVQGVSTRKVKAITEELCGHSFSASSISAMNQGLDASLAQFAGRPLAEAFPYLILDARYERGRGAGVIPSQAVLIAIGIDWDGRRQVLAVELANRESRSSWRDFLLGLKARGLHGGEFVVADDHAGLRAALREVLAEAAYQRCYVHFLRNALDYVPRRVDDDCLQELRWLGACPRAGEAGPGGSARPRRGAPRSGRLARQVVSEVFEAHRLGRRQYRREAPLLSPAAPAP